MNTFLNVPFAEKDQAKALGARWDPNAKKWYCPDHMDIRVFARWLPKPGESAAPVGKP